MKDFEENLSLVLDLFVAFFLKGFLELEIRDFFLEIRFCRSNFCFLSRWEMVVLFVPRSLLVGRTVLLRLAEWASEPIFSGFKILVSVVFKLLVRGWTGFLIADLVASFLVFRLLIRSLNSFFISNLCFCLACCGCFFFDLVTLFVCFCFDTFFSLENFFLVFEFALA